MRSGLLEEVAQGTPLGRLVASGAETLGRAYGVTRIPTVKGQSMPAYDPRAVQGIGVTYATSTMGADHTAGYAVAPNVLGIGGRVDPLKPDGQMELSRNLQIATAAIDASGLCLFVAFAVLDDAGGDGGICEMLSGLYGRPISARRVSGGGRRTLARGAGVQSRRGVLGRRRSAARLLPHRAAAATQCRLYRAGRGFGSRV